MQVGSGDTYQQYLPGQSFDITDLPNGAYYIEIIANPNHELYESDVRDDVSVRKVIISGSGGSRKVVVPRYGLIGTS